MASSYPFAPLNQTILVGATALQVPTVGGPGGGPNALRIRCLITAYLTWGQTSSVTAAGAPSAGNPVTNTIGMTAGTVEVLTVPPAAFFISSVAAAFELTPGDGV